jgi:hypothetical protein
VAPASFGQVIKIFVIVFMIAFVVVYVLRMLGVPLDRNNQQRASRHEKPYP